MGLKCSVLGHRFEEPGLVHEREQSGDEIIIIKRKVRVCTLCGEQRVLAESKEITKQIDDDGDDGSDATDDRDDSVSAVTNDGSVTETTETNERRASHEPSESESTGFAGIDTVYDGTAMDDDGESTVVDLRRTDDDGIILTEEDSDTGREYGEWPTESNETGIDTSWEPEVEDTSPQPSDAKHQSVDALADDADDGEIIETSNEPIDETSDDTPDDRSADKKTLACRTCDFSVIASDSPYRSGDICPGCHESYLTEGV